MRRGELAALEMDDVDLEAQVLVVRKSKTKPRTARPDRSEGHRGGSTVTLRVRKGHPVPRSPKLWLGLHGPITGEGIRAGRHEACSLRPGSTTCPCGTTSGTRSLYQRLSGGGQEHDAAADLLDGPATTDARSRHGASACCRTCKRRTQAALAGGPGCEALALHLRSERRSSSLDLLRRLRPGSPRRSTNTVAFWSLRHPAGRERRGVRRTPT